MIDKNEARQIRDEIDRVWEKKEDPSEAVTYIAWCAKLLAALEYTEMQRIHWWLAATSTDRSEPVPTQDELIRRAKENIYGT